MFHLTLSVIFLTLPVDPFCAYLLSQMRSSLQLLLKKMDCYDCHYLQLLFSPKLDIFWDLLRPGVRQSQLQDVK